MNIAGLDLGIIIIYLLLILGFGFFIGKKQGTESFFVNNRKTKIFLLIFTAFSTSVGAGTVIGVASAGYTSGISYGVMFMLISGFGWWLIAWLAPRIKGWADGVGAYTLGDYFEARFSPRTRKAGSLINLIAYFIFTAVQFIAFARLIEAITDINFTLALLGTAILTIAYTVFAGIKGDFYTDAIQFFVMFPVFVFVLVKGLALVGISELFTMAPDGFLNVYNYAGPVTFYGGLLFGFPLLLVSMDIWQRIFAALDEKTARRAFVWSGILKVIVIGASILIGLMAVRLVPGVPADSAIFSLMKEILPSGLLGLGFAGILAILMSTVDSMIMVGSATFTKDFYLQKSPNSDEKNTLRIGRLSAAIFGGAALVLAIFVPHIVRLGITAAQMLIIFAPALLGGLLWKRVNEKAAFWSIIFGFFFTLIALPFIPDQAFVPGVLASLIAFFWFVWRNKPVLVVTN